jgi:hypothetical protein
MGKTNTVDKINNQIKVTCLYKYRDNSGKIVGYKLQDIHGKIQDIEASSLKNMIASNQIEVNNLTLTSDGRLMTTTPKIQSLTDYKPKKDFKGVEATKRAPSRKDPKHTFKEIDKLAEQAASLLATYKYNADIKTINKTDSHIDKRGNTYDTKNIYISEYDVYFGANSSKPDKLYVSISYSDDVSDDYDYTEIGTDNPNEESVSISVSRGKGQDPISIFEHRLIEEYPAKPSMKDKAVINRFTETHKNGEKSTFRSLFKMFDKK